MKRDAEIIAEGAEFAEAEARKFRAETGKGELI